jgi:hypothetical protein
VFEAELPRAPLFEGAEFDTPPNRTSDRVIGWEPEPAGTFAENFCLPGVKSLVLDGLCVCVTFKRFLAEPSIRRSVPRTCSADTSSAGFVIRGDATRRRPRDGACVRGFNRGSVASSVDSVNAFLEISYSFGEISYTLLCAVVNSDRQYLS